MHKAMNLSDTELERCDREWVERVLRKGEDLLLVLRPRPKLVGHQFFGSLLFIIIPLVLLVLQDGNPLVPILLMFIGLWVFISMLWKLKQEKRSIYLVTNLRMVYLFRSGLGREETDVSYELRPNVQLESVVEQKDGTGYIAFNYEDDEEALEYGGLLENVPQVQHVAELLHSALKNQCS